MREFPVLQRYLCRRAPIANDAPTDVALLASSIAENASNDTIVASITSMDADTPLGDTATYTLVDDAGGRFAISGTDLVVADGSLLDAETAVSHSVTVRATDAHGLSDDQIFNISVNRGRRVQCDDTGRH